MGFFYGAFGTTRDRTHFTGASPFTFYDRSHPRKVVEDTHACSELRRRNLKALKGNQRRIRDQMFYVFGNFPFDLCLPSIQPVGETRKTREGNENNPKMQYLRTDFHFEIIIQVVIALERRLLQVSASSFSSVKRSLQKIIQHEILHHRCFIGCCCKNIFHKTKNCDKRKYF